MSDSQLSLGIHFNEQDELEVFAVDDESGDNAGATFESLIDDWIADQAIDGELHPYLDDTLNMLAMLTHAQKKIVAAIGRDDPHVSDMWHELMLMADMLERLKDSLR